MKISYGTFISVLLVLIDVPATISASYKNCRMLPGDGLIYHRRLKQGPTRHVSLQIASYPEILVDLKGSRHVKVITCILCKDLKKNATRFSPDSECRVLTGGVGHTFVKIGIACGPWKGYDYDVKIYGRNNHR